MVSNSLSSIKGKVSVVITITRFRNWLPLLQENLIAALLLAIVMPFQKVNLVNILLFTITIAFFLTYSFVINDVCDKDIDNKAGKIKPIHSFSRRKIALILCLLICGSIFLPLYFGDLLEKLAIILAVILLTFYSMKPIRFKERDILAIIVADAGMRDIPFLIFGLLISATPSIILFFLGWLFIIGFQDELGHQLSDFKNDEKSGARTWVQHVGREYGEKVLFSFVLGSFVYLLFSFLVLELYAALAVSAALILLRFVGDYGKGTYHERHWE
jgi:4-hydroxybenzoate polyprenyltransferase